MSQITQLTALGAVGMAGCTLIFGLPRIHPAVIAYVTLIAFWGLTVPEGEGASYLTMVKLSVMTVALHLVIRTPKHLLVLFGAYCISGLVALLLNLEDIKVLRQMMETQSTSLEHMRLDGTFSNANRAGSFAATVTACALITFFNSRHPARWLLVASGVGSGLIIGGLSGSRMGMLGILTVCMAVPFMATAGEGRQAFIKGVKAVVVGVVVLGIAVGTLAQMPQFERLKRLTEGASADGSAGTRWDMAQASLEVWSAYPITGAGFRGFERVSRFTGRPAHTTFGEVVANGGAIGFTLIGIFYFLPGLHLMLLARFSPRQEIRRLAVGLLAFCAMFAICSLFAILHNSKDLVPLLAAVCGVIQQQRSGRTSRPHPNPMPRNQIKPAVAAVPTTGVWLPHVPRSES